MLPAVVKCCLLDDAGGGSLLGTASQSLSESGGAEREQLGGVDIVYLKNVLLKFLDAAATGRTDQVGPPLALGAQPVDDNIPEVC